MKIAPLLLLAFVSTLGCTREADLRAAREARPAQTPAPAPAAPNAGRDVDAKLEQLLAGQEQANRKLDYLIAKVEGLEKKVASIGGGTTPGSPAAPPRRAGPDPAAVYAVALDGGAVEGPAKAKVTVVVGFEFACPFCQRVMPTLEQLRRDYGKDLRIVKMMYIVHPERATVAAQAYCAAAIQGRHVDLEARLWNDAFGKSVPMDEALMIRFATELGLDVKTFTADMGGSLCKQRVAEQQARLAKVGVTGTPAFFINGRFLSGAQPIDRFKAIIDEELKKANEAIGKGGLTVENYYDKVVMGSGKTGL